MTEILTQNPIQEKTQHLPVMAKDSYYLSRLAQQLKQIKDKKSEDYATRFDRYQKQLKNSQEMDFLFVLFILVLFFFLYRINISNEINDLIIW